MSEYVITDGERFLKQNINGKYNLTNSFSIADVWNSSQKAEGVLRNSVPPGMRFNLYVAEFKNGNIVSKETTCKKRVVECRKTVREDSDGYYKLSKYSFDDDENIQDIIKGFEEVRVALQKYASDYSYRKSEEKVMRMNYVVEDIKHYHGKKALNARDGFKLNRLEDEAVIKRISAKNQFEIIKKLNKYYDGIIAQINDICSTIDELRNQTYKPRVLIDLFENDNLEVEIS